MLLKISLSKSITLATTFCNQLRRVSLPSLYMTLLVYIVLFDGDSRHHRVVLLHCCVWFPITITHTPLSSRKYQSALCSSLVSSKIYILWLLLLATTESTYTEPCLVLRAVGSLDAQHILARTSNTASNTTPNNLSNKMLSSS